jgi:drug/metabolite transporter (DMT)-like permease
MVTPPGGCNPGLWLALSSALAYCCFNVGVRFLADDLTVWGMLLLRGGLGVVAVTLVARRLNKALWGRNKPLLAGIGVTGFLSTVCTTTAISRIPLYQALALLYLYPAIGLLLAAPLNREPVTLRDGLLVAVALAGCGILIWPSGAAGLTLEIGHLIGFTGSFLFSLSSVLTRRLKEDNSGLEPIFHYSFQAVLWVVPLSLLFDSDLGLAAPRAIWAGLALGALGASAQLMCYASLRWLPACRVGVIGALEVLGASAASWLLFNDPMSPRALFGGALIVFVVLSLNRAPAAGVRQAADS